MASVHRFVDTNGRPMKFEEINPHEAVDIELKLSWAVLNNPEVDILGYLFGMSFKRFNVIYPDKKICKLISLVIELDIAIEINSYYHPDSRKIAQWGSDYNVNVTFGSNAHSLKVWIPSWLILSRRHRYG